MFWFIMYENKCIKSTPCEHVCFQGSNSIVLFFFKNKYWSSSSRFETHIVSTVILINYERTHKATTRQCLKLILLAVKTPTPHNALLLSLSHIYISNCYIFLVFQITRQRVFRLHVLIFWQVDEWLKLGELGSVTGKNRLRRSKPSGHLLKKVNKPARNLPVPVKGWDLTTHQWKILIAMEGPHLEATESSAVIHWVCTEFCSMHERQKLN